MNTLDSEISCTRFLAKRVSDNDELVERSLANTRGKLPRTRIGGVEIHTKGNDTVQVDRIAGLQGRLQEIRTLQAWADAHPMRKASASSEWMSFFRVVDELVGSAQNTALSYEYIWLEADGNQEDRPPALVVKPARRWPRSSLCGPLITALRQVSPKLEEYMGEQPFASFATLFGWMPGRGDKHAASGRLIWTMSDLESATSTPVEVARAWGMPDRHQAIIEQASDYDIDWAIALNIMEGSVVYDGLEIGPLQRPSKKAWQQLALVADELHPELQTHIQWLLHGFGSLELLSSPEKFPDHIMGVQAGCIDAVTMRLVVRPTHVKIQPRSSGDRFKRYAHYQFIPTLNPNIVKSIESLKDPVPWYISNAYIPGRNQAETYGLNSVFPNKTIATTSATTEFSGETLVHHWDVNSAEQLLRCLQKYKGAVTQVVIWSDQYKQELPEIAQKLETTLDGWSCKKLQSMTHMVDPIRPIPAKGEVVAFAPMVALATLVRNL